MLSNTARGPVAGRARSSWLSFTLEAGSKPLPPTRRSRNVSTSSSGASSSRAHRFWTSDDPLLKALRRRQESYRLASIPTTPRHKADRQEAVQLAKSEIRWLVEHVRRLQTPTPSAKSALNCASRRHLISAALQMTRRNVPLSYLLGSIPFGALPQELTVRAPVLLPRPETEHWATEVVRTLVATLTPAQLASVRVVDLCTGSGCIALLIAHALRARLGAGGAWRVGACDRSPLSVELARENAVKLGFDVDAVDSNVHVVQADVFDDAHMDALAQAAGGPFHLIVSNPPYIPRREWNTLPAEVKTHEDPAALIGERDPTHPTDAPSSLDRAGLTFHHRLAALLYRATFSTSLATLPRLVAEYGKGQQRQVERLHAELRAPSGRLPRVVRLEARLVVVGVGNATTHPLTRHSVGQVVLDPLLRGLVEEDRRVRARLRGVRDALEAARRVAVREGRVDGRRDWEQAVPTTVAVHTAQRSAHEQLDLTSTNPAPLHLTKVTAGKSGGWSATLHLLIPSSPTFLTPSSHPRSNDVIYQVQVSLYKPSQPMNLSGVGLKAFLSSHSPSASSRSSDVLVLQDELDLPFGAVKRKDAGSARGHNGIRDILHRLDIPSTNGTPQLARLRIGIGRPDSPPPASPNTWLPASVAKRAKPMPVDRWVLSPLTPAELDSCQKAGSDGSVLGQVQEQTVQWVRERCLELCTHEVDAGLVSKKDQFGVFRTVWVE
ncbi:related to MTQ1-S-adenosylmethionine-dependent methyltransferase [Sporisorium reilianum f. sp. reilianum]|uniref:Related to MTQ1-S-adenosylmethionine-dependent methyltransferase n=1 Tax=Sporisorium reilianum f. sp. reilianum TaxID=72559 RepID=A0A2N8UBF1_9BASI|nr:related to MTQ1-S-adenosylmethionine-dependent methyltransferase [Sporisorium reilianum f. sp. reilianum]